jgi:HEAT repeat protein
MSTTPSNDLANLAAGLSAWLEAVRQGTADHDKTAELWNGLADGLPAAVGFLSEAVNDTRQGVRVKVVAALGALCRQCREAQPALRSALKRAALWDEDDAIRRLAVEALAAIGEWSRTPIADLIQALNDPEAAIRFSAAQGLGERAAESESAVGLLLQKALRDPDGGVRLEAAMALYKIDGHAEKILPMLIKALHDPDEVRRWIAADCLGEIGPAAKEAVPALRGMLEQDFKSPLIRASVALALQKIEGINRA